MFASPLRTIICLGVMGTLFTGCATKTLMTKDNKTYTRTNQVTLIEDQVVAFGKPAQPLPNLPAHSLVIAGQQKSCRKNGQRKKEDRKAYGKFQFPKHIYQQQPKAARRGTFTSKKRAQRIKCPTTDGDSQRCPKRASCRKPKNTSCYLN